MPLTICLQFFMKDNHSPSEIGQQKCHIPSKIVVKLRFRFSDSTQFWFGNVNSFTLISFLHAKFLVVLSAVRYLFLISGWAQNKRMTFFLVSILNKQWSSYIMLTDQRQMWMKEAEKNEKCIKEMHKSGSPYHQDDFITMQKKGTLPMLIRFRIFSIFIVKKMQQKEQRTPSKRA